MANEADTCRQYVLPKLAAAGWTDEQIGEQRIFTAGRILVRGRQGFAAPNPNAPIICCSTGPATRSRSSRPRPTIAALPTACSRRRATPRHWACSSHTRPTDAASSSSTAATGLWSAEVDTFPAPGRAVEPLSRRQGTRRGAGGQAARSPTTVSDKVPRYYQQIAINRAVEAILPGKRRVLLTLATGTGKTVIAFQIAWKLWNGQWNTRGAPKRDPRILFLADRSFLVDDPKDKTFAPFGDARGARSAAARSIKSREIYFATYQAIAGDRERAAALSGSSRRTSSTSSSWMRLTAAARATTPLA